MPPTAFDQLQARHFADPDPAKFAWQTGDAYLSRSERALLGPVATQAADRLLEIGCGEGGNLALLEAGAGRPVGIDRSSAKIRWARGHVSRGRFVCADGLHLPFRDESFDLILCRDVLHHVEDKRRVVTEMLRVCRPAGRLVVIEPNGWSPIMWLFGTVVAAERDLRRNSRRRLRRLLDAMPLRVSHIAMAQPFPFGRALFHYRWGLPRWSSRWGRAVLAVEAWLGRLVPQGCWAYMIITIEKGAQRSV